MAQLDQFKNFRPGNAEKPSVIEPEIMDPQSGTRGVPGLVVPAKIVATNKAGESVPVTSGSDSNGGGRLTSTPINAGTNRKMAWRRADLRTPRPRTTGGEITGTAKAPVQPIDFEKTDLEHLADIKSASVETKTVRGAKVVSRKEPAKPEVNGRIIGNPLGDSQKELEESTTMRMGPFGEAYDKDEMEVAQAEDTARLMDLHKRAYGDWRQKPADVAERTAETGPGLAADRRERRLARRRGSKATGFSGHFDAAGNPIKAGSTERKVRVPAPAAPSGTVIPMRAIDTDYDEGVDTDTIDKKNKEQIKNRIPGGVKTGQYDPNKTMARPERGRTSGSVAVDESKLLERNAKLDAQGKGLTQHSPEVMATARAIGRRAGLSEEAMNHPLFSQSEHVTRAYVMHTAGASEENLNKHLGGRPLEAQARLQAAYKTLNEQERFNNTKAPGSGYTYSFDKPSVGQGKVQDTDYFKASNGEHVLMSNLSHPEHPLANGGVMEGSHVPFRGFVPRGDGTYAHITDIHHGWAPYNRDGKRVFEYHSIPESAIHEAEVTKQAINTGTTASQIARQLAGGKETDVEVQGKALTAAPKAPIKGASNVPMPEFTPQGINFPASVQSSAPSVPAIDTPEVKAAKAHKEHLDSGELKTGCVHCSKLASAKSREDAAATASTFIPAPQPPRAGSGSVMVKRPGQEAEVRPLTDTETTAISNLPKADDSKFVIPTVPKAPKE